MSCICIYSNSWNRSVEIDLESSTSSFPCGWNSKIISGCTSTYNPSEVGRSIVRAIAYSNKGEAATFSSISKSSFSSTIFCFILCFCQLRQPYSSEHADDCYNNHELNQGEAILLAFLGISELAEQCFGCEGSHVD